MVAWKLLRSLVGIVGAIGLRRHRRTTRTITSVKEHLNETNRKLEISPVTSV